MKQKYNYSRDVKAPASFGNYDITDLIRTGKIQRAAGFFEGMTRRYKSKIADIKRCTYASYDKKEVVCYEFTPLKAKERYPAIVYFHGGGFMFPIQTMMMKVSSLYADSCGVKVFLPEYRYDLKDPQMMTLEDCYHMLKYVYDNADALQVDRDRIIVYGDSAGGCLCAGVTLMNRDRDKYPIAGQMLIYPVTDNDSYKYDSMDEYAEAAWSKRSNIGMWELYLSREGDKEKYLVPMHNDLCGLPRAYVEPQEIDTLCDEGVAYAKKLREAGVETELNIVLGSYHGFDAAVKSRLVQRVLKRRYEVIRRFTT